MALCGACNLIIRPTRQLLGSYSCASASKITLGGQWAAGSSRETEGWEITLHSLPSYPRSDSDSGQ